MKKLFAYILSLTMCLSVIASLSYVLAYDSDDYGTEILHYASERMIPSPGDEEVEETEEQFGGMSENP